MTISLNNTYIITVNEYLLNCLIISNFLSTPIICTILFQVWGHGFGGGMGHQSGFGGSGAPPIDFADIARLVHT